MNLDGSPQLSQEPWKGSSDFTLAGNFHAILIEGGFLQ